MEDVDRISDLHDSILSHILSFLAIEEAVGTSVLSTRWRYLFSLLPNIDLDLDDKELRHQNLYCDLTHTDAVSFLSFVDGMLSFDHNTYTTKLDKFCLKGMGADSNRIYRWISTAAQRGIKYIDFDLSISFHDNTTLPDLVFTCRKLTTLKLKIYKFDFYVLKDVYFPNLNSPVLKIYGLKSMLHDYFSRLDLNKPIFKVTNSMTLVSLKFNGICPLDFPKDVHCPNLKTLHLELVQFLNDDSIKNLLSGCCSLEDMVIIRCWRESESNFNVSHHLLKRLTVICLYLVCWLIIDAPNLAYFKYENEKMKVRYSIDNLPSLVKADIHILFNGNLVASFFKGMSNVRSLILTSTSLKHLLSCDPLPVFANLLELEIHYERSYLAVPEVIKLSNFRDDKYCIGKSKIYRKEWCSRKVEHMHIKGDFIHTMKKGLNSC